MPKDNDFSTQDFLDRMHQWSETPQQAVGVGLLSIGQSLRMLSESIDKVVALIIQEIEKEVSK